MEDLQQILDLLDRMPEADREKLLADAFEGTGNLPWVPNPGPQTVAYDCFADELFYGGQAGGGKTDLLVGLALTAHKKSLLVRRTNKEALGLHTRIQEVLGSDEGLHRQDSVWKFPSGRTIDVGGCQLEHDKQKYKGNPHDLICFDEISDFTESQYIFISGWNRTTDPNQRCRIVAAGNPPTRPEGLWVIKRWAAWLDPNHANPAKPGELRWYTTSEAGDEIEVDGPGPHWIGGEEIRARSRTFIPAELSDNPDLAKTNYGAVLAALPEDLRAAYRDGRFDTAMKDRAYQVIPTEWVVAAQRRWRSIHPPGVPMSAIGVDVAQGGRDETTIAVRYDGWYDEIHKIPGKETPTGNEVSGAVFALLRDNAQIVIDVGGGYGGVPFERLKDAGLNVRGVKGSEKSVQRSREAQMRFFNKRAELYWRFREALDPSQQGGSTIALPDDPEVIADLTAPTYKDRSGKLAITPKEDLVSQLGRSPDVGDAIVLAWSYGDKGSAHAMEWGMAPGARVKKSRPRVIIGRPTAKR